MLRSGLLTPADLDRWIREAGLAPVPDVEMLGAADLDRGKLLREAIYRAVFARISGRIPAAGDVELLNAHAAHPPPAPRLGPDGTSVSWQTDAIPLERFLR